MPVWDMTLVNMTVDGSGDLELDAYCIEGTAEQTSKDVGSLSWYWVEAECKWEQIPAGGSDEVTSVKLYVAVSEDNLTWTSYTQFAPLEAYFRYIKYKIVATGDPGTGYRVQILRLDFYISQSRGLPRADHATAQQNSPPASPTAGSRYIVGPAGAGAWAGKDNQLAVCVESTTPTWRFTWPKTGMKAFNIGEGDDIWYDGTAWRTTRFFWGRKPLGYGVEVDIAAAVLQTVKSITWAAGDYSADRDEFFVKIAIFGGANPPVAVPTPQVDLQIYDDVAAAWTTIWTNLPGQTRKIFRITVTRAPDSTTDIWAIDTFLQTVTNTAGPPFPAGLFARASGLRVIAMGDTGSKCNAWLYVDRQK